MVNMNNNDNTYIEYLNNVVTNLSKNEEDKKKQKMYDIFITIMIFVPIIISPILIGFNQTLIGILLIIICWGLLFIIGTNRRKNITKGFYKIKDAHTKFNIINVNDEKTIKELYDDSALTFIVEPSNRLLDFIFNWLNNENVLKSDSLNLYVFDGKLLKSVYDFCKVSDNMTFMSIFNKDLDINETNIKKFSYNHFQVKSRWLDDIVNNDKDKVEPFKLLSPKADYMIYFNSNIKYNKLPAFFNKHNQNINVDSDTKENIGIKSKDFDDGINSEFCITGKEYKDYLDEYEEELKEDIDEDGLEDYDVEFNLKELEKLKKYDSYYFIKSFTALELKYLMLLALFILEENGNVLVYDTYNGLYYDKENIKDVAIRNGIIEK